VLEVLPPDRPAEQVERLAQHAFRGEVWEKALVYCRQAGDKAFTRAANREAVACFEQALAALQHLPESRAMQEQTIDLRLDLHLALYPLGEPERGLGHLHAAAILAETLHDQHRLGLISASMTGCFYTMGDLNRALVTGQRTLALAATVDDFRLQVQTNCYLGIVYCDLGDYRQAMDLLRRNVASLKGDLLQACFGLPGLAAAFSRDRLVWCLAEVGEFAEGIVRGTEAIRLAEASVYPYSLVATHFALGFLYLRKGELPQAIPVFEHCLALYHALHLPAWFPVIAAALGGVYALAGRVAEAIPLLEQAVERTASMRHIIFRSAFVALLSETTLLDVHFTSPVPVYGLLGARASSPLLKQAGRLRSQGTGSEFTKQTSSRARGRRHRPRQAGPQDVPRAQGTGI
jgi:tetratricopeptide (TPR) repeat protein